MTIDLNRPFPRPVPGFGFIVSFIRSRLAEARVAGPEHLAWAEHCQRRVPWQTRSPLLALAMWQLATDATERAAFIRALTELEQVTQEAAE